MDTTFKQNIINTSAIDSTISLNYQYPLNEKTRTLLRLEELFSYLDAMINNPTSWGAKTGLSLIIDLINFFERGDLKGDLIKELEKHITYLNSLKNNASVDHYKLDNLLDELRIYIEVLQQKIGKVGQRLKEIELINIIRQRINIPGGNCHFDLPLYHEWLNRPAIDRTQDLQSWFNTFTDFSSAINCILKMLRNSSETRTVQAEAGFYQQPLESANPCQLVSVHLNKKLNLYPEISGGKHRLSIRFLNTSIIEKPEQTSKSFTFELKCCFL